ncbi:acid protease [Xylariaceae sp. AK1471]|nr:acid protease [Xylariaceae sp. AK1471]
MHHKVTLLSLGFIPSLSFCAAYPRRQGASNLVPLTAKNAPDGNFFDVEVTLGDAVFKLLTDTGSSDLWVARTGFQFFDPLNNTQLAQAEVCMYEAVPKYDPAASATFSTVNNQTFGVHYGDGIALGSIGTEQVKLGGITVPRQTIGIADRISTPSDGASSGILGLGYPILTSAHPGISVANDTLSLLTNKVLYAPLLFRMHTQGLIPAWFSLALERLPKGQYTGNGGNLGLGVLPNVMTNGSFVAAPVEATDALPVELTGGKISEWTWTVDRAIWSARNSSRVAAKTNTTSFQAVVDNGNFFNQLPLDTADQVNAEFAPPATYDAATDSYLVSCDAVPPSFGVVIAGTTFSQHPDDMIFQLRDGTCVSTVKRSGMAEGLSLNFLGGAWLQNVVAVFDFGKDEMRFARRADAGATSHSLSPMTSLAGRLEAPGFRARGALSLLVWGLCALGWVQAL